MATPLYFCFLVSLSNDPELYPLDIAPGQTGHGHSEAFGVITRVVFPDVALPRLAKVHAPDNVLTPSASIAVPDPSIPTNSNGQPPSDGLVLRSEAVDNEKEASAAEAELLDTLVGLVALRGGIGEVAPHGSGGLGAEGGSLGSGRYTVRLSEGRESSGKAEESTLLNLLFVPDGRYVRDYRWRRARVHQISDTL